MSAQTDPQFLERDEFYLSLRLIALAQNNMEVSEESIRINHPIPPLPKIDLKSSINNTSIAASSLDQSIISNFNNTQINMNNDANVVNISSPEKDNYTITEEDDNKYLILFNKNKDFPEKISFNKINDMFIAAKIPSDTLKKIFDIVQLTEPKFLNSLEFKVVFHLIYKSYIIKDVPSVLPNSLKYVLSQGIFNKNKRNEIDFNLNKRITLQNGGILL
jgi:hypothetical protein